MLKTQYKTNYFIKFTYNCISAKSAPQILSIKDKHSFAYLTFLIIGLCNSSAGSLFKIVSFLSFLFFSAKIL